MIDGTIIIEEEEDAILQDRTADVSAKIVIVQRRHDAFAEGVRGRIEGIVAQLIVGHAMEPI